MEMQIESANGLRKAVLDGRLDTTGACEIELRFSASVVPPGENVVIDLTRVSFMGSLGIRLFISAARGLAIQGKKLVLFGPTPEVMEILETAALSDIIPIVATEDEAIAVVGA